MSLYNILITSVQNIYFLFLKQINFSFVNTPVSFNVCVYFYMILFSSLCKCDFFIQKLLFVEAVG